MYVKYREAKVRRVQYLRCLYFQFLEVTSVLFWMEGRIFKRFFVCKKFQNELTYFEKSLISAMALKSGWLNDI